MKKEYIALLIVLLLFLISLIIIVLMIKESPPPELILIEPETKKEPPMIFQNISPEVQKIIKEEEEKIQAIMGYIKEIKGRTLIIEAEEELFKGKIFEVKVLEGAEIKQTTIDPATFVPETIDFSFEKININNKIIVWSKEGKDIKEKDSFETEYLEIISE